MAAEPTAMAAEPVAMSAELSAGCPSGSCCVIYSIDAVKAPTGVEDKVVAWDQGFERQCTTYFP